MTQLHERYRPREWSEVVGQPKALERIEALRPRGFGGRSFFLSGASGVGKTTIARLLAAEVADDWFIEELDASELTPPRLRDIENAMSLYGLGRGGRAYIVNEAHGLRRDTIRQLLVLLERLPEHVLIVFTTTKAGQEQLFDDCGDTAPLLSRCVVIPLTNQGLSAPFAARAQTIAQAEGINGQPTETYRGLAQRCKNNLRAMLQAIDAGELA